MESNGVSREDVLLSDGSSPLSHPLASASHLCFRVLAIVVYLLCEFFTKNFIASFVIILLLLSLDFWTVKNITGRLLVGLRWWNYVDDQGVSHWIYESRQASDLALISPIESRLFWTTLFLFPLIWSIFLFVTLFGLKLRWFVVVCIALSLNGANLYGYVRCKLGKKQSIGSAATSFLHQNVLKSVFQSRAQTPQSVHTI